MSPIGVPLELRGNRLRLSEGLRLQRILWIETIDLEYYRLLKHSHTLRNLFPHDFHTKNEVTD